jgi:hypothetical protein
MIRTKSPPLLEGIDSFFGFQLAHALVDPLLEAIAEPPLEIIRNPDRCSSEESGNGRPGTQSAVLENPLFSDHLALVLSRFSAA